MTQQRTPLTVLLAVDGSEHSLAATRHLIALFGQNNNLGDVRVINVQQPIEFLELVVGPTGRAIEQARKHVGHTAVHAACALLEKAGLRYEAEVIFGEVVPTIDAYAREHDCGLIVIGPRGLGPIRDLVLGSVAMKLIQVSRIPLLLAR